MLRRTRAVQRFGWYGPAGRIEHGRTGHDQAESRPCDTWFRRRINPEGSEVEYQVWFWPGCQEGFCERAPPQVVAVGHLAAGTAVRPVSVRLAGLTPGVTNDGYWITAKNANGTSEGVLQTFATPRLAGG